MTYKLVISAIIASSLSALPAIAKTSVTKGNGTVRIANEHVAMEFADNGSFDIVSMKFAGTEMAKPGDNRQPWSLTYLGEQGETPTIEPRYAVYHGWREEDCDTSKAIVFSWHTRLKYDGNNYPVEMRVSLDDNADLLRWNLSANVPDNWTITNFVFPNIAIDSPVEGKVITPGGWGNEYALKENGDYEANYPSWNASMQMIMLDSKKGTFYFSPEDRNACGKMMRIREKDGAVSFRTEVAASYGWTDKASHRFNVPWSTVTGTTAGGWSEAAVKWYRPFALSTPWGSKTLKERNIPEWLEKKDL